MEQTANNVTIKYIFDKSYNPQYVNGAAGGVNPAGELIVHFYLERFPLPYEMTHEINEDGTLGAPMDVKPDGFERKVIRYINQGVIMNLASAEELYNWLGNQIRDLKEREDGLQQSGK